MNQIKYTLPHANVYSVHVFCLRTKSKQRANQVKKKIVYGFWLYWMHMCCGCDFITNNNWDKKKPRVSQKKSHNKKKKKTRGRTSEWDHESHLSTKKIIKIQSYLFYERPNHGFFIQNTKRKKKKHKKLNYFIKTHGNCSDGHKFKSIIFHFVIKHFDWKQKYINKIFPEKQQQS